MNEQAIPVRHNRAAQRFEADLDGASAVLEYEQLDGRVVYLHTEVPAALAGRGIGGALARTALEAAQMQGLTVVPRCSFVRGYIARHPAYQPLVDAGAQPPRGRPG
jgi:uncharacterized protein